MRKFFLFLFTAAVLFHFGACKKDNIVPIDFSQYTATDSNCIISGVYDNTDWTYDTTWTATETALMSFNANIATTDSTFGYVHVSPACPNPNNGLFIIGINTEKQCKMKIVCVNTSFETLYYTSKKFTGGPIVTSYDFSALTSFHPNENYRLYYAFYNSLDSIYYKGHGDIRIE